MNSKANETVDTKAEVLDGCFALFEVVSDFQTQSRCVKSMLYPVGEVEMLEALASILVWRVNSLLSTYLGLPLGTKHKSKAIWDPINERFELRIAK